MGVFDRAARFAVHADPQAAIHRLVRLTATVEADEEGETGDDAPIYRQWGDSRTVPLPDDEDRTADHVMILDPPPGTPDQPRWLWVWEFQAEHDPDKIDVLLEEVARFRVRARYGERNRTKYRVFPVLVVLQGRCPASDARLDMTWRGLGVSHAPLVWNVADDSAQATLAAIETGADSWTMLFWVPLMSGSDDPDAIAWWVRLVRERAPSARERSELVRVALPFAELAGRYLVWEQGLEGQEMTESAVVNEWTREARRETELKTTRNAVIRALRQRFGDGVSAEVVVMIEAQTDLTTLTDWFDEAVTAPTWEWFLKQLRG